jgi:hypothetical protein
MSIEESVAEMAGEVQASAGQRARAVRVIASTAADVDECREMLEMLGLDPREARLVPQPRRPDTTPAEARSASG